MKYSIRALACIITLLISTTAQSQIYESKDANGNPVFTDSPAPEAIEVDLPQSNIADAVTPSPGDTSAPDTHNQGGNTVVIPNSSNEELERGLDADRRHEVLDAEPRHEVGDTVKAEEKARR